MRNKYIHYIIFLQFSLFFTYAQSIDRKDLEKIVRDNPSILNNVGNLKNNQSGFNLEEKDSADKQKEVFLSPNEIKNAIEQDVSVAKNTSLDKSEKPLQVINDDIVIGNSKGTNITGPHVRNRFFGYSTFQTNPSIFSKSTDISTPPNYIIGPGDEIIIMLWGQTEDLNSYIVTKDGYIFINNIGQVFVNGLTLEKLEKKLKNIFKKSYSSISPDGNRSPTFFDVSLGSIVLKPIRVFVMGEVNNPGAYEMKPSTTLFSSLYFFNGPKTSGSLRDIHLIRNGKKIGSIDFYDFLIRGEKKNDVDLLDGDVIFIPLRHKTISVTGPVKRPAKFELLSQEKFDDLEFYFGGYKAGTFFGRAQIDRIIPLADRENFSKDKIIIDFIPAEIKKGNEELKLFDGDKISFFKILDEYSNEISISGPLKRPGVYALDEGMTIKDLIEKAEGFINDDIYRERVEVIRKIENGKEVFLSFNLDSILSSFNNSDYLLKPNDQIIIEKLSNKMYEKDLQIIGFVKNPGQKTYREGMTVFDLIFLGGGFQNEEHLGDTYLPRADLYRYNRMENKVSLKTFSLDSVLSGGGIGSELVEMGDKIVIYSKNQIAGKIMQDVGISGFVKLPGKYEYVEDMFLSDLLFIASGFEDKKQISKVFTGRADINRFNQDMISKTTIKLNLANILNDDNDFSLKPGDEIVIYSDNLFKKIKSLLLFMAK